METASLLEIGRIVNTHGVRGEIKLEPWADSPEALLGLKSLHTEAVAYPVERSRVHGKFVIFKLQGVDSVEAAMPLKGRVARGKREELPLPEGRFFLQDLLGLPVWTEDGTVLGTLTDVLDYPAGRVFVVKGKTEHLIPEKGDFLQSLDPSLGHLTVRLLEGM